MEKLQYGEGVYTSSSSLPTFYMASDEYQLDYRFTYTTTVIGSGYSIDYITLDYKTLSPYGYTTLNSYSYDSNSGTLVVDFTITVNRATAGGMLGTVSVLGTLSISAYNNGDLLKTLSSTINPTFSLYDRTKASVIAVSSIGISSATPDYNTYSVSQSIKLTNILADSLTYDISTIGNIMQYSSSLSSSALSLSWTEMYYPTIFTNTQRTKGTTPKLNCQFVVSISGISSKNGKRVSATAIIDKAYNDLLDNISVEKSHYIPWNSPKYNIEIGRLDNYSATITSSQFIINTSTPSWYKDKQILNTSSTEYTVSIYSEEIKASDSRYYRLYFSNGKKVDVILTKNGYPKAYTPTIRCNFTLPIDISDEVDYSVYYGTDVHSVSKEIAKGHLYPYNGSCRLCLGDLLTYYSSDFSIDGDPSNVTTDNKHSFSWASQKQYKAAIFMADVDGEPYYISPYIDYNHNTASSSLTTNLLMFSKSIYKGVPFFVSVGVDYNTELSLSTHSLNIYEWNSTNGKYDSMWSKSDFNVCNGVVHNWFKYNGKSSRLKIELLLGNSVQYVEVDVKDTLCESLSYGYVYYINSYGGIDIVGVNTTSQETDKITISDIQQSQYTDYRTDYCTKQYAREIVRTWSAKTDILTDKESKALRDLAQSNTVKLYIDDEWIDVNVTDTSYTVKTLRNNSMKKFNLTFKLEEKVSYTKING